MNVDWKQLTKDEMTRAGKSLKAAEMLLEGGLYEDAVSRAYYTVLHAAKAALANVGQTAKTHQGVKLEFGKLLVKDGPIEAEFARLFAEEQDSREFCDYEVSLRITKADARQRVKDAERFMERIRQYLEQNGVSRESL